MRIYLDLDGVMCNFLGAAGKLVGKELRTHKDWDAVRDLAWRMIRNQGTGFWSKLEWMPDGRKLWDYIKKNDIVVLSAYPSKPQLQGAAKAGKLCWVNDRLGSEYVVGAKVVPVQAKQVWATRSDYILIDDNPITIKQWNAHGAIGILHTSTENTIKELKKLGI